MSTPRQQNGTVMRAPHTMNSSDMTMLKFENMLAMVSGTLICNLYCHITPTGQYYEAWHFRSGAGKVLPVTPLVSRCRLEVNRQILLSIWHVLYF